MSEGGPGGSGGSGGNERKVESRAVFCLSRIRNIQAQGPQLFLGN